MTQQQQHQTNRFDIVVVCVVVVNCIVNDIAVVVLNVVVVDIVFCCHTELHRIVNFTEYRIPNIFVHEEFPNTEYRIEFVHENFPNTEYYSFMKHFRIPNTE